MAGHCLAAFGNHKVPSQLNPKEDALNLAAGVGLETLLEQTQNDQKDRPAVVLSVLGSTTSGKSTITRAFRSEAFKKEAEDDGGPQVLNRNKPTAGPTTSGCWHYRSFDQSHDLHLLDMEGMDGANVLPTDESEHPSTPSLVFQTELPPEAKKVSITDEDYFDLRAVATKEHLPRLAYICSDIVIFVSNQNVWAGRSVWMEMLRAAKLAAPRGICSSHKPHCIVIWNRANSAKDTEEDTQRFLSNHDKGNTLGRFYRSITVLRLHDWDINEDQFYHDLQKLRNTVTEKLDESLKSRKSKCLMYNSLSLIRLLSVTLSRFHSSRDLWFDAIIFEVLQSQEEKIQAAIRLFFQLYWAPSDYTFACEIASRFLACNLRLFLYDLVKDDPSMLQRGAQSQVEQQIFEKFSNELAQFAPCDFPLRESAEDESRCVLLKSQHGSFHQSEDMMESDGSFVGKEVGGSVAKAFNETISSLTKYQTAEAAFRGLVEVCNFHKRNIDVVWCVICLEPAIFECCLPCGHAFCHRCQKDVQMVHQLFGSLESVLSLSETPHLLTCPRCILRIGPGESIEKKTGVNLHELELSSPFLEFEKNQRLEGGSLLMSFAIEERKNPSLEREVKGSFLVKKEEEEEDQETVPTRKVIVYTSSTVLPDVTLARIREIFGIYDVQNIGVVDVESDQEVQAFLSISFEEELKRKWSETEGTIVIGRKVIGYLSDLEELHQSGEDQIRSLLSTKLDESDFFLTSNEDLGQQQQEVLELSYLNQALDIGEHVVKGLGTVFNWSLWGEESSSVPSPCHEDNIQEFVVVHTNWYWRRLHRIFRFQSKYFTRVHPSSNVVRATKTYEMVQAIKKTDANNFVIEYNDGGSPDFIRAAEGDVNQMIKILQEKNPNIQLEENLEQ